MAEISGFFPSINGDRRYRAADWADFFAPLVNNGVFPKPPDGLQITAGEGMQVIASAGRGWINGNRYRNTANLILPLTVADGLLSRIDRAVMRRSLIERNIRIRIKEGMLSLNPEPPALQRDADIYELALADVRVNNGATQITQADITDHRFSTELCGIVTGAVDQIDFDILTVQFNDFLARFKDGALNNFLLWFETIKDILDEEVAGNLLLMIQELEAKTNRMGVYRATLANWDENDECWVANPLIQSNDLITIYPADAVAHDAVRRSIAQYVYVTDGGFYVWRWAVSTHAEINIAYTINREATTE